MLSLATPLYFINRPTILIESIRRKLNHSIKILDHVTFDVDGVGSSVEDSLVYMLETGRPSLYITKISGHKMLLGRCKDIQLTLL